MTEIDASSKERTKSVLNVKQQQKLIKQIEQIKQKIFEIARENREMFVSVDLIQKASVLTNSRLKLHEPGSGANSLGSSESRIHTPSGAESQSVQLFGDELESREGTMPEALMAVFLEDVDYLYVRSYKQLNEVFHSEFQ
jgi:hypothetical protein